MARLTILQASQQGFGSTLTIHRHIKEGSLPIYEEGDVKLLEVDDLISLLGEPGTPLNDDQSATAEPGEIDIYEYHRMKSDLDQKNKKNMWLAADLAEVVRELKEKEAKFDAERDRLLKVLEQAQALLLREAKRVGSGGLKNTEGSAPTLDRVAANGGAASLAQGQAPANPENKPLDTPMDQTVAQPGSDTSGNGTSFMPGLSPEEMPSLNGGNSVAVSTLDAGTPDAETLADTKNDPPNIIVDGEIRPKKRAKSRNGVNPINPLTPPLDDAVDEPPKSRLIGTTTWLILLTIMGVGFVFFEFRTEIASSVAQIMETLGGA